jgi:acyl-CoA synthetase (AMP-forming)/AMP-acid ligase II
MSTFLDKAATIMGGSGEVITYRQLDADANRLSRWFHDLGLRPGDHVAFCLENHPRFFAVAWGAHYAGLIYTAISSRLTVDETEYILDDCGAEAFITSAYKSDVAAQLADRLPRVRGRLMIDGVVDGFEPYDEVVGAYPAEPLDDRVEGVDMLYSSGTTGQPKGVLPAFTESPLGAAPSAVQGLAQMLLGYSEDAVPLHPAPLYHSAPLRFCMAIHRCGGTVIATERFDAEESLALIERYRVTTSQWVPTMFVRMLKLPDDVRARYDLASLVSAAHAAAPCPIEVKQKMIDWWGPILHEYYAGTEGNGITYCNSEDWLTHQGTVGRALVGEIHIVGDDGEEVPVGEVGTIYFGSASEFAYHNDPEKTAQSRHPEGWSTLGDIGRLDEDGFLYLTDHKANMIISGGVNIYPQEAENVLTLHPKVFDVAVFGVPNDDFGEEVKAVVQPVDMTEAGPELERELIAYCREQLADVKCPRSVDFEADLPRHPTGKLYKRLLRDRYWGGEGRLV